MTNALPGSGFGATLIPHPLDRDSNHVERQHLPAAGNATPAVYELNGRQYVVIACGGGKSGAPSGGKYVAFALPVK